MGEHVFCLFCKFCKKLKNNSCSVSCSCSCNSIKFFFFTDNELSIRLSFRFEWKEISQYLLTNNLNDLKKYAIKGNLKSSKFRSICWALFFGLLDNENSGAWGKERAEQRKKYIALKEMYYINPQVLKNANDDPLSQSDKSVWNQHFCDQELCAVIKQDVVRTFPGIDFFRKSHIQEILVSILFCYARQNPDMCYRQGMHEIIAPILFVIHSDHQAYRHYCEMNVDGEFCPILEELLIADYLEADAYSLFNHVMVEIEHFYRINDVRPTATGYFPISQYSSVEHSPEETVVPEQSCQQEIKQDVEVIGQLNIIREQILAKADPALYNHLMQLDIPLSLFGIRWLRLLFGREFALLDLLILWDAIFAEDEQFNLTSYVVVAMLITIREKIINSDYTSCLTFLMKYPNTIDISMIIKLALHIKSPQKYENPFYGSRGEVATLPRKIQKSQYIETSTNKFYESNASSTAQLNQETMARVNGIQKKSARATVKNAAQSQIGNEHDLGIVEGYRENDPEVSILTLQHAQSIMSISRYKLIQYVSAMRKNLPENTNPIVHQSLDGIEEICSLLKNCYSTYAATINIPCPVEPAFEANEAAGATLLHKPLRNLTLDLNSTEALTTKKHPWRRIDDNSSSPLKHSDYYEIPENSLIANKLFGNVREIPMRVFKSATAHEQKSQYQVDPKDMLTPDPTKDRKEYECLENENESHINRQ